MKFLILLSNPCAAPAHDRGPRLAGALTGAAAACDRRAGREGQPRARALAAVLALLGLAGMAGCASAPYALEASFGTANESTRMMQTADPLAPWRAWHHGQGLLVPRSDGVNARLDVQHFRARLARPDAPASVLEKGTP
jgi:hypothetical protein